MKYKYYTVYQPGGERESPAASFHTREKAEEYVKRVAPIGWKIVEYDGYTAEHEEEQEK